MLVDDALVAFQLLFDVLHELPHAVLFVHLLVVHQLDLVLLAALALWAQAVQGHVGRRT